MSTTEEEMKDMKLGDLRSMVQKEMILAGGTEEEVKAKIRDRRSYETEADEHDGREKNLKQNYWIGLYKGAQEERELKAMGLKDLRLMVHNVMIMAGDTEEAVKQKIRDRTSYETEADEHEEREKNLKQNYWIGLYKEANDKLNSSFDEELKGRRTEKRKDRIAKQEQERAWMAQIKAGGKLEDGPMRDWAEKHGYVEDEWGQAAPGTIPGDDTYQMKVADDLPTMTDEKKLAARREAVKLPADATEKEVKKRERMRSLKSKGGLPLTATDDEIQAANLRQQLGLPVSATDDEVKAARESLYKFDEFKVSEERFKEYGLPSYATEQEVKDVDTERHKKLKGQREGGPDYTPETVLANLGLKASSEPVGELEGLGPYLGTEQIDPNAEPKLFSTDELTAGGKRRRKKSKKRTKKRKSKKRTKKRTKRRR